LFFAALLDAPELEYKWFGQLGDLLRKQKKIAEACSAYNRSLDRFGDLQRNLASSNTSIDPRRFRLMIEPIFASYLDLLLQSPRDCAVSSTLAHARDEILTLKKIEIQNYFQDQCAEEFLLRTHETQSEDLPGVLFVYPMILPDKLFLLYEFEGKLFQHVDGGTDRAVLEANTLIFRGLIEAKNMEPQERLNSILQCGAYFYDVLFRPFERRLTHEWSMKVDTVAFVPDGALALLPLAALYDGRAYLGDQVSLAIIPGRELVDFRRSNGVTSEALATGKVDTLVAVAAAPAVGDEIKLLHKNEKLKITLIPHHFFTKDSLDNKLGLRPYRILHIATHASFGEEQQKPSISTGAGPSISLEDLEQLIKPRRFREQDKAIEVMTLSACETAKGNERMALGLAGSALKSGARSVLASLWEVEGASTALLVNEFYLQALAGKSKAEALQSAQQKVKNEYGEDPRYWAPFVIIGDWQ
jgi:CHAT domain-containing protein